MIRHAVIAHTDKTHYDQHTVMGVRAVRAVRVVRTMRAVMAVRNLRDGRGCEGGAAARESWAPAWLLRTR